MNDVFAYSEGMIHLALADGSDLVPGQPYHVEEFEVELVAQYPNGAGYTRWAAPSPDEQSVIPGEYSIVENKHPLDAGDGDAATALFDAQFVDDGVACRLR